MLFAQKQKKGFLLLCYTVLAQEYYNATGNKLATTWFSEGILVLNQKSALAIQFLDTDPEELKLKIILLFRALLFRYCKHNKDSLS